MHTRRISHQPPLIISLGGSLVCPKKVDTTYLQLFSKLVSKVSKIQRVIVIVGGGAISRTYQEIGRTFTSNPTLLDWIGIMATRLNAQLVAAALGCKEPIITDPTKIINSSTAMIVGAGWKPGCSTDHDAVLLAQQSGASTILNLTNQEAVYTSDPKKNKSAQPIPSLSWKKYKSLIKKNWRPGLSTPFDPTASKEAMRQGLTVFIIHGKRLDQVLLAIQGKPFQGTIIHP